MSEHIVTVSAEAIPLDEYEDAKTSTLDMRGIASPLVEVTSPANLAEGYSFRATLGNKSFYVTVPRGGVEEGQTFLAPWPDFFDDRLILESNDLEIPRGDWRDGLCNCFVNGVCHPVPWNSLCFPLIAIFQVMTRLRISWTGEINCSGNTFRIALLLTFISIILISIAPLSYIFEGVSYAYHLSLWFYLIYLVTMTRFYARESYSIPSQSCGDLEDPCCSIFCTCCTISQIARHTTDYSRYHASCCTKTGLSSKRFIGNNDVDDSPEDFSNDVQNNASGFNVGNGVSDDQQQNDELGDIQQPLL